MQLFRGDVLPPGEYLYLDLDVVITGNIDCFLDWEGFGIGRDFINPERGLLPGPEHNSSVMRVRADSALWNFFTANTPAWEQAQKQIGFFGDQNVISAWLNKQGLANPFPDAWCWSYKKGVECGKYGDENSRHFGAEIPEGGRICVFHGEPKPEDVSTPWVLEHWR
ncbi:MAG: hypothetical protein MO853_09150 [Candidatus Protistobacter heckmanni]|nr:hypothetical protein [Candidatus Protistobacter heckmanni]